MMDTTEKKLNRYFVFKSAKDKRYLCIVAARNRSHALKIARQSFRLHRDACAIPERVEEVWRR